MQLELLFYPDMGPHISLELLNLFLINPDIVCIVGVSISLDMVLHGLGIFLPVVGRVLIFFKLHVHEDLDRLLNVADDAGNRKRVEAMFFDIKSLRVIKVDLRVNIGRGLLLL